jgi:hypothetical protein
MKFEAIMDSKVPDKIDKRHNKYLVVFLLGMAVVINDILPFLFGYYFAVTQNIIFLLFFILSIVFSPEIDFDKTTIKLRMKRVI